MAEIKASTAREKKIAAAARREAGKAATKRYAKKAGEAAITGKAANLGAAYLGQRFLGGVQVMGIPLHYIAAGLTSAGELSGMFGKTAGQRLIGQVAEGLAAGQLGVAGYQAAAGGGGMFGGGDGSVVVTPSS